MKAYLDIARHVLENGKNKHNRTGTDAIDIGGGDTGLAVDLLDAAGSQATGAFEPLEDLFPARFFGQHDNRYRGLEITTTRNSLS